MSNTQAEKYARRFAKVLDHIESNLGETLSTELLSQVANFSKFHFHRQFAEYVGTSVGRYIQLLRLRQASYRLAFSRQDKIIDIALDAGFENPESFYARLQEHLRPVALRIQAATGLGILA